MRINNSERYLSIKSNDSPLESGENTDIPSIVLSVREREREIESNGEVQKGDSGEDHGGLPS